jgi:hypothetical protein
MSSDFTSYSQSDRDLAVQLVSMLFRPIVSRFSYNYETRLPDLAQKTREANVPDIYWDDVLEEVQSYRKQTSYCQEHNLPIFCIEPAKGSGSPVPISLDLKEMNMLASLPAGPIADQLSAFETVTKIRPSPSARLTQCSAADALGFYQAGLTHFLTVRLAAATAGRRMYKFEVSTKSSGLRAYWTSAGCLRRGQVFGSSLTTPVNGSLPSGWYCFGAGPTQPGATATYDMKASYYVPTQDKAYLGI